MFVVKIKEYCRVNFLYIIDLLVIVIFKFVKIDGGEMRKDGGWECYDDGVGWYLVRYLVSYLVILGLGWWIVVLFDVLWEFLISEVLFFFDCFRWFLVFLGVVYFLLFIVNFL